MPQADDQDQTFAGALTSTVTCSACKTPSVTVDPIMDIQLDFPRNATADQSITLASLLKRFCADERVGDQGKGYACSSCGGGPGAVSSLLSQKGKANCRLRLNN